MPKYGGIGGEFEEVFAARSPQLLQESHELHKLADRPLHRRDDQSRLDVGAGAQEVERCLQGTKQIVLLLLLMFSFHSEQAKRFLTRSHLLFFV